MSAYARQVAVARVLAERGYGWEDIVCKTGCNPVTAQAIVFGRPLKRWLRQPGGIARERDARVVDSAPLPG